MHVNILCCSNAWKNQVIGKENSVLGNKGSKKQKYDW